MEHTCYWMKFSRPQDQGTSRNLSFARGSRQRPALPEAGMDHEEAATKLNASAYDQRFWEARYTRDQTSFEWYTALTAKLSELLQELQPGCSVLDLGCGTSALAEDVARLGFNVTGVDYSAASVALCSSRPDAQATYVLGDALALPFPPSSFAAVLDKATFDVRTHCFC